MDHRPLTAQLVSSRNTNYAASIILIHQKTVLVRVVYEPNRDELFYAWRQGGAFLNKPIQVSSQKNCQRIGSHRFPCFDFERLESYTMF